MNRKSFVLSIVVLGFALLLTSCLFDSEESSFGEWLSDQGMPNSYKVQTLSVEGLVPLSAESFMDSSAVLLGSRGVFGAVSNISHDVMLDFAFWDTTFFADLKRLESPKAEVIFHLLTPFYRSNSFPVDSLPIKEDLAVIISWKIDAGSKKSFVDSIGEIHDTIWRESFAKWSPQNSDEVSVALSLTAKDSILKIKLPETFIADLQKLSKACRLQLRLSAPEASHLIRFYGPSVSVRPVLQIAYEGEKYPAEQAAFRAANLMSSKETCSDCNILHGGIVDSLVVEFPSKPIMEALSDFYGDEFPFVGSGDDARQAVVMAQMTFSRDDSQGSNELGHPIQVVVGSYVDGEDSTVREMESYKLNKKLIVKKGHPNLVFHDGDSLTLQVTSGLRDFINRAADGRTFKMMMRLGYPMLQEKDSLYADHKTASGDSSYVFFSHFDYARYDFTSMMKNPATLKLWLATKRGDEE